jgi:haloalkane dehalogenase
MTAEVMWPPVGMAFEQVELLGSRMSYVDGGSGRTLLFLHGNPTSSFLWRGVLAGLVGDLRCVAVDLIGMGRSGKPDIGYGFGDHAAYLEAFVDRLSLRDVTVVGHDWGAVLGLNLLRARTDVVAGVVVCEGHLRPFAGWQDMDEGSAALFSRLRAPGVGERMVLAENFFIEQVLPAGMNRTLTDAEWEIYRAPFRTAGDRVPILRWIQQIPVGNDPAEVDEVVRANQTALLHGKVPRLLVHGRPGSVVGPAEVAWCRREGDGLDVVDVGPGTHFLPEDQPAAIARAIRSWLNTSASLGT